MAGPSCDDPAKLVVNPRAWDKMWQPVAEAGRTAVVAAVVQTKLPSVEAV